MIFNWVSHEKNFLLRLPDGGLFEPHSDLVARFKSGAIDKRLVVPAGSAMLRRVRRGRARAALMRPLIEALPVSPKDKHDAYLAALHLDRAPNVGLTRFWLRVKGIARHQWRYGRSPK